MSDPYRRLKRQIERKRRREYYRQLREDKLLDIAYRGYTEEQRHSDEQLNVQVGWLNRQLK